MSRSAYTLTPRHALRLLAEMGLDRTLLEVIGRTKNWVALRVLVSERLPGAVLIEEEPANDW